MKITRENNNGVEELVLRLPLFQDSFDASDTLIGQVPNLVANTVERKNGMNEYTINYLIDLGYKESQQLGMPIICFDTKEELKEVCKELKIDIDETPICAICDKPLYGSFTMNEGKLICFKCKNND